MTKGNALYFLATSRIDNIDGAIVDAGEVVQIEADERDSVAALIACGALIEAEPDEATKAALDGDDKTDDSPDIEKMTKAQLVAFAKENLGVDLDEAQTKAVLIAQVNDHIAATKAE